MANAAKTILIFFGSFTVIGTLLPFIHKDHWWIRGFDFPRAQIALVGLATVLLYMAFWNKSRSADNIFLIILVLSISYQIYCIYPYTFLSSEQVLDSDSKQPHFSMLISNVLMSNRNIDGFFKIAQDTAPDIILAMETDAWWEKHLRRLEETYPYAVKCPLENTYGMLLYSKLELIHPKVRFLVEDDVPSIHSRVRVPPDTVAELRCLHPRPPRPFQSSTERDIELLLIAKEVRGLKGPVIVAGDLNDVAWSYTTSLFQKISGLLDPRVGRGLYNTFNAKNPLLRFPLDHLFHSNHFKLIQLERLPSFGSDHFPIHIRLSLEPEAEKQQEEPSASKEDLQKAEEELGKGGE